MSRPCTGEHVHSSASSIHAPARRDCILHRRIIVRHVKYLKLGPHANRAGWKPAAPKRKHIVSPGLSAGSTTATMLAVEEISDIVSAACFAQPDKLTEDGIHAYALALLQLREYAGMAGMERLMNACDALAVTVSKLIDDRSTATRDKCEALKRFVVHAREMVLLSGNQVSDYVMPPIPSETRQMNAVAR
jgi:hypothetical protein